MCVRLTAVGALPVHEAFVAPAESTHKNEPQSNVTYSRNVIMSVYPPRHTPHIQRAHLPTLLLIAN